MACHQSWCFVGRHFQFYDTFPSILNWPGAWPCWNCIASCNVPVSVEKMGEGGTRGAYVVSSPGSPKAKSSGEDLRANGGLVSNLPHPRVNQTKRHARVVSATDTRKGLFEHWCAQLERPFWRIHAMDFWATDTRKVWGKSRMRATYIPEEGAVIGSIQSLYIFFLI